MNSDILYQTTMDPSNRKLVRVIEGDYSDCKKTFNALMSSKTVKERKAFIKEIEVNPDDLDN